MKQLVIVHAHAFTDFTAWIVFDLAQCVHLTAWTVSTIQRYWRLIITECGPTKVTKCYTSIL